MIDIFLDYFRLVAYGVVLLASLKGIAKRKFSGLLLKGDIVMVVSQIATLVYAHLFNAFNGIWDEVFLTIGASAWAIIHFISLLKEDKDDFRRFHK
jgi:hypothetical protein